MTRNLKIYIFFSIIWSIMFFTVLNYGVSDSAKRWPIILSAAAVYGTGFWLVGYFLGKQDDQKKVRYSLEMAYSAVSDLTSAFIGSLWIIFFRPGNAWVVLIYIPLLFMLWVLGYKKYRNTIKGMPAKELFK